MHWTYTLGRLAEIIGAECPASAAHRPFSSVSIDTRTLRPGDVFFALSGENFDGNTFTGAAAAAGAVAAVCSRPAAGLPCLVVENPLEALQGFAVRHRKQCAATVIALTGSCGKTTTKDLIAALLSSRYRVTKTRGNFNNDIGCPLSLLEIMPDTEKSVIELGANHPGEIAGLCRMAEPDEVAVTLVAPAHLEGFGTIENVAAAKEEIVQGVKSGGIFYVNTDNPWCRAMGDRYAGPKIYFGRTGDIVLRECAFADDGEMVLDIDPIGRVKLPLSVRAHASNVLLAIAVARQHGITVDEALLREACRVLKRVKLYRVGPIEILDDAYNANPASMAASLEALADRPLSGKRIAALGSMLELGEAADELHYETGKLAGQLGISPLYALGPHAKALAAGATATGATAMMVEDHDAIAEAISLYAQSGDALLVKGSRGMRMEKVVEALRRRYCEI